MVIKNNSICKRILFLVGLILVSPLIILTKLETVLCKTEREHIFSSCIEILSVCPTLLGVYMRKAFYWAVCADVSTDTHFLFGSWLAHRNNIIKAGVVIGAYTFIGYAEIEENVLMGARVSIISGKYQHGLPSERADQKHITERNVIIRIGKNAWIGQDSVILANIGENSIVGAGSVVLRDVPDNTTVLGNPARKVNLDKP